MNKDWSSCIARVAGARGKLNALEPTNVIFPMLRTYWLRNRNLKFRNGEQHILHKFTSIPPRLCSWTAIALSLEIGLEFFVALSTPRWIPTELKATAVLLGNITMLQSSQFSAIIRDEERQGYPAGFPNGIYN